MFFDSSQKNICYCCCVSDFYTEIWMLIWISFKVYVFLFINGTNPINYTNLCSSDCFFFSNLHSFFLSRDKIPNVFLFMKCVTSEIGNKKLHILHSLEDLSKNLPFTLLLSIISVIVLIFHSTNSPIKRFMIKLYPTRAKTREKNREQ